MNTENDRKRVIWNNIAGAYLIKVCAVLVSFFLFPAYLAYFDNAPVLGAFFILLTVCSWITSADAGIAVGLRNRLTALLFKKDEDGTRKLFASTYGMSALLSTVLLALGALTALALPWGKIFGIEPGVLDARTLKLSALILFAGAALLQFFKLSTSVLYARQYSAAVDLFAVAPGALMLVFLLTAKKLPLADTLLAVSGLYSAFSLLPYIALTAYLFFGPFKGQRPSRLTVRQKEGYSLLKVGFPLFLSQTLFLIVSTANEVVVGYLTDPADVVTAQAYFKVFKLFFLAVSLTLTPIWSAVTDAKARGDYEWIAKTNKFFLGLAAVASVAQLALIPLLPFIFRIWLGENFAFSVTDALPFALFSAVLMFHAVSSTVSAGLSSYRLQIVFEGVAAVLFLPLSVVLVNLLDSFTGVILANAIAHLPYEIGVPIRNFRKIKKSVQNKK